MKRYAEGTATTVEFSRGEIKRLVEKYGGSGFSQGEMDSVGSTLAFQMRGRWVRFEVPYPKETDRIITHTETGQTRPESKRKGAREAEIRRRWRVLVLRLKAKLESLLDQTDEEFEREFLGYILLGDGGTVYDQVKEGVKEAYLTGKSPKLLPSQ